MSTTNTDHTYYWYIRKVGRRYVIGLVNENGEAPDGAYTLEIMYDRFYDEVTRDDDIIGVPIRFESALIKGVAAELMKMDSDPNWNKLALFEREYEKGLREAIHFQIGESQQPCVQRPFDLRDDG